MPYQVNFGRMTMQSSQPLARREGLFRIAVLADFSAGANAGRCETGDALAARKPWKIDCENLDATLARRGIVLKLRLGSETVEVPIASMDDFHPDQLFSRLAIFRELAAVRKRLNEPGTAPEAVAQVRAWGEASRVTPVEPDHASAPDDFSRLLGVPAADVPSAPVLAPGGGENAIGRLLRQAVGPHIVAAIDPRQPAAIAAVDAALADTMRGVLHHPDFQALEAAWRSADFLVRRLETDECLQVVLYDVSAAELAADLTRGDALEESGLYRMLVEHPARDANQGPFSVILGNFTFERSAPHAEILGRLAGIVAQARAPFLAALDAAVIDEIPESLPAPVAAAWTALKAHPEAAWIGLATPRFPLRLPYGSRTEELNSFAFEEFDGRSNAPARLWGNPAIIAGLLLGQSFTQFGGEFSPDSILSVSDMPLHIVTDPDDGRVALPCTERVLTERQAIALAGRGLMPLVALKGSPEVRLAGFRAINGEPLAGSWAE